MPSKIALENLKLQTQQKLVLKEDLTKRIIKLRAQGLTFEVIGIRLGITSHIANYYYRQFIKEKNDATPVEVSGT